MINIQEDLFETKMTDAKKALDFVYGGNATFTVVSNKTGTRFTFRAREYKKSKTKYDKPLIFVKVLTGTDNENSYTYIGFLNHSNKGTLSAGKQGLYQSPSFKAMSWVVKALSKGIMPEDLSFYHCGKCARCGRTLTVPESIESGFGPICASRKN